MNAVSYNYTKGSTLNHIAFVMLEKPRNSNFWSNSPKWLTICNGSP